MEGRYGDQKDKSNMKQRIRILLALVAVMLCGAGTAQAATDDLNIVTTGVTGATVTAYMSTGVPTASAPGTAATTVQHGQYLVLKVTPATGKWLYEDMLEVQVAGGPGGALVRTRGLVVAEHPTALGTNAADGTGYYYYKIPAECTAANGYKNVVVTGAAVSKIDLSSASIDATGKVITASADGWTATINLDDVSWTYDASSHGPAISAFTLTNGTKTFASPEVQADKTKQVSISGEQTNAGNYNATLSAVTGGCFTSSKAVPYSITANASDAVVVTITGNNASVAYDGTSHSVTGYTVSISNSGSLTYTESDFSFSGTDAAARTDVGTTNMELAASQFTNTNPNFSNVTFNVTDGYQTITAKEVGLTWTNGTPYTYDGSAKAPTVEVTAGDLVAGDACTVDVNITAKAGSGSSLTEGKAVNVGNYTATATGLSNPNYKLKDDALKASDFSIVASDAATAVVTANDRTYDGTTQDLVTIGAITYGATGTAADVVFYADATSTTALTSIPQGTNAGSYDVYYEVAPDANHTVPARAKVIVTISQAAVTIKAKDQTVDFGTNITQSTDQVTVAGLQGSDALNSITLTASTSAVTTDGSATITPSAAVIKNGTTDVTANYSFTYDTGKLIINAVDPVGPVVTSVIVTITGHNSTEVYDGKEHSVSGYEVEISDPLYKESDFIFSGTAAAARTDAGTTNMGLAASQFTNTNANFSVTFNVTDGFVTISQKGVNDNPDGTKGESQVTIVIDPTSFVYNGKDQKPTTITVKDGDSVIPVGEYTVSYQLGTTTVKETKEVGTYTVVITDNAGGNYTVSGRKDYTITQKPLTITAKAKTISYGSEGSNNGVTYSGFVEGENETTEGVFSGTLTYQYNRQEDGQGEAYTKDSPVGTYYIIPSGLTSKNYAITFKAGILTVSDKVIVIGDPDDASADATIILNQAEFIYNGKDQKPEVTITLKDGNKVIPASEYVVMHKNAEGKELKETKDAGTYTLEITSKEGADYAFSGKTTINYTIKPKTLTVTAIAQTKNVGEDDPEFTYTYDGFVEGDEDVFSGALARDEGEDVGEYAITQGTLSAGDNYTIAFTGAKLTIKDIKESFKVVVAESEGGSVSVSKIEASPGTQINMKITPVTGYHLETITIKKSHGGEVQHDITFDAKGESWDYFLMPSDDVIITAVFEKDKAAQNIFIYKSYYGEVVANTNSADENEQVNLVAHPAYDNCVLDELVVINDEGKQLDLTTSYDSKEGNIYTFMMTGNWVQVYSTFRGINDVVDGARPFGLDNRFYQLSQKDQSILQTTAETKDVQIGLSLNANIFCQVADDGSLMMEQGEDVGLMIGGLKKGNWLKIDHDGEIALKNPDIIKEINDAFPQPAHILTRGEDTAIIKPGVAYEVVEDGNLELVLKGSAPLVLKSIIVEGPDPTAINRLQADDEAADIYDLSGRKVDPTSLRKGMYIRNGKKIIIK